MYMKKIRSFFFGLDDGMEYFKITVNLKSIEIHVFFFKYHVFSVSDHGSTHIPLFNFLEIIMTC